MQIEAEASARSSPGNKKQADNSYGRFKLETKDFAIYFESPTSRSG